MSKNYKNIAPIILSLLFIYVMMFLTFSNEKIFWYLYAFTLLVGIAISLVSTTFKDELPTWNYLLFGIGYGTILYGIVKLGNVLLPLVFDSHLTKLTKFLNTFGPQNIWHYLMLVLIIVIGEEMFWRGYVQQKLKQFMRPVFAVFITAVLFSIALAFSGFIAGAVAALFAGIIFGLLYEWKKSLPLIIVAHETFVILLFLVLPL